MKPSFVTRLWESILSICSTGPDSVPGLYRVAWGPKAWVWWRPSVPVSPTLSLETASFPAKDHSAPIPRHGSLPADRLIRLPDGISDLQAAAVTLKGITAQYLLRRTYRVKRGDTILFHAAAGGVGSIACQWAKHLGATVIGTAGGPAKASVRNSQRLRSCHRLYAGECCRPRPEITAGKKVQVVYDWVGHDTFAKSLDCLAPLGVMVSFGSASGPVAPFDIGVLAQKGSLFVTRASLSVYGAERTDLLAMAKDLFDVIDSAAVKIDIKHHYPLSEAAQAHRELAARNTIGSIVLTV